jgi:hypothetical protein
MAKDKRYYYACVTQCQMGFMAPDQRRENWGEDGVPAMVLHERSFMPQMGKRQADILCTAEPISRRYTEEQPREFTKVNLRTGDRQKVNTPTIVKFVLMDPEEIDGQVRRTARFMTLRDCDLAKTDKVLDAVS